MTAALAFLTPPPGLAPHTEFVLNAIDGATGLYSLQAAAADSTRLFVLDAAVFLPAYTPYISSEQSASLELTLPTDALLLVVANPGEAGTTVNLMAPIVVNAATGVAAQLILEGQDWPLQAPLEPRAAA
ncbi:MAG: flagellar assembly protein FliW [Cryobacterium sp.]